MSGPKRNPDKLNTIGVVVVGICGAVLVYVSIVALQAFYMNDTSEVQNTADYGGQEAAHQSLRATQVNTIEDCVPNGKPAAGQEQTYKIPIKYAIKKIADEAKVDPSNLVPSQGRSDKPTILPIFGRPKVAKPTTPATPATGTPVPGTGSPEPATMTPTGGQGPGGGTQGGAPNAGTPSTPTPANTGSAATPPSGAIEPPKVTDPNKDAKKGDAPKDAAKTDVKKAAPKTTAPKAEPAKAGTPPKTEPAKAATPPKTEPAKAGSAGKGK